MAAPAVLLANEAGAGRGHVTKLAAVARALGSGLPVHAGLASHSFAAELRPVGAQVFAAPPLDYSDEARADPSRAGNATWADYLAACGFTSEEVLRRGLAWWRERIVDLDAAILVADYAPLAMRAAQGLKADGWDIEIVSVGTGYGVPPAHLPRFPQLLPDHGRSLHSESELLALLNRVGAETGLDPLPRLPALYEADLALPATFGFLDPYAGMRGAAALAPPILSGTGPLPDLPERAGDELFVYFGAGETDAPEIVAALEALPMARRGHLPGARAGVLERLRSSGMILHPEPVSPAEIAMRSRLVLSAAPHGTLCMAALCGLPQVALPRHLEQVLHGRRAEARGILRHLPKAGQAAEAIRDLVRSAWSDATLLAAAREAGRALRADYPADPEAALARRLAPVLARARAASGCQA